MRAIPRDVYRRDEVALVEDAVLQGILVRIFRADVRSDFGNGFPVPGHEQGLACAAHLLEERQASGLEFAGRNRLQ